MNMIMIIGITILATMGCLLLVAYGYLSREDHKMRCKFEQSRYIVQDQPSITLGKLTNNGSPQRSNAQIDR